MAKRIKRVKRLCPCGKDIASCDKRRRYCDDCRRSKKKRIRKCLDCDAVLTGRGRKRCPEHSAIYDRQRRKQNKKIARSKKASAYWPQCADCGAGNPGRFKRCEPCRHGERECITDGCLEVTPPGLSRCADHVSAAEVFNAYIRQWQRDNPLRVQYWNRRREARLAGLAFEITPDDLEAAWPADEKCPVCRCSFRRARGTACCPSIDRFDNSRGYEAGNVSIICLGCNGRKNAQTIEELVARDDDLGAWARDRMKPLRPRNVLGKKSA